MEHEARDSGGFLVGQAPVEFAVEVADRDASVDDERSVSLAAHSRHGDIVLVVDLADDFLDDVFQGHNALQVAVFVHY